MATALDNRRPRRGALVEWGRRYAVAPTLLLLAFVLPPTRGAHIAGVPTLCGFRSLTGLPCPGCGITRSVVCAAHGDLPDALRFHPLGPLVLFSLSVFTLLRLTGMDARLLRRLPRHLGEAACALVIVALIGIWVARLVGWLPTPP